MKYMRPEMDIIEFKVDVIRTSGDYIEGETILENDKVIQAPNF